MSDAMRYAVMTSDIYSQYEMINLLFKFTNTSLKVCQQYYLDTKIYLKRIKLSGGTQRGVFT